MKKEKIDFSWHARIQCEQDAQLLAHTRSAEALKLLMISAVESGDIRDFFVRCYAMALEQSIRNTTRVVDPFRRPRSAIEHVKLYPNALEEEKKRFPRAQEEQPRETHPKTPQRPICQGAAPDCRVKTERSFGKQQRA
eukprot:5812901-Amphidinium_carterae.3